MSTEKQLGSDAVAAGEVERRGQEPDAASGSERNEEATAGKPAEEIGGPSGPEPTRYGDWERKGRCIDF